MISISQPQLTEIWSEKVPNFSQFRLIWPTLGPNLISMSRGQIDDHNLLTSLKSNGHPAFQHFWDDFLWGRPAWFRTPYITWRSNRPVNSWLNTFEHKQSRYVNCWLSEDLSSCYIICQLSYLKYANEFPLAFYKFLSTSFLFYHWIDAYRFI